MNEKKHYSNHTKLIETLSVWSNFIYYVGETIDILDRIWSLKLSIIATLPAYLFITKRYQLCYTRNMPSLHTQTVKICWIKDLKIFQKAPAKKKKKNDWETMTHVINTQNWESLVIEKNGFNRGKLQAWLPPKRTLWSLRINCSWFKDYFTQELHIL